MTDFAAARENMIESQVRPNGITDRRIIQAMGAVARHEFVPEERRAVAYVDEDVALGGGRMLMEAMAFARLVQLAAITPQDRVLMVGAGSGYGAAVVASLAGAVVALESDAALVGLARRLLGGLGNVQVVEGRLETGAPTSAPFDAILLEGRVGDVPKALLDQLAGGGRLVAVVGETEVSRVAVYTRGAEGAALRWAFDASVAPLPGFAGERPAFVF
jgi:protein-L-isoaspartate(D-aspartate) O-methyltransferase